MSIQDPKAWHALPTEQSLQELQTSTEGLAGEEIKERQKVFGFNKLPDKSQISIIKMIISQLINPLIFILIAAAIASVLIGEGKDAIFIFLVILINTVIGVYQEYNAEKSASNLTKLLRIKAKVKRSSEIQEIDSEDLVPGDVVILESGNKVPADLRLIQTAGLEIDESFLTGESQAIKKNTETLPEKTPIADRKNIAHAGATVMSGRAQGLVITIGLSTEVGKIAKNVQEGESAKPPLIQRMESFTKKIANIIIILSVVLALLLRFQGMEISAIFFFVVALAVSAIPEGLPVSLTVALAVATRRMAKRNVIVRKLTSVESLGSCTVIASDKTGTLTVNQQTVKKIYLADGTHYDVSGEGYNGIGEVSTDGNKVAIQDNPSLLGICKTACLANESKLEKKDGDWEHYGDAMDVALLGMAFKADMDPETVQDDFPIQSLIPYESERKFSGAFYKEENHIHLAVKGAIETILGFCKTDEQETEEITELATQFASEGYRVLAFASGVVDDFKAKDFYHLSDIPPLTFQGLVCFIDPLRSEAIEAVGKCRHAGIQVMMITGDHPATASTIAKELGLKEKARTVVTGAELEKAGGPADAAFQDLVASTNVFARVSPTQKLEIVDVLIQKGEFVAVTGDGVNDAPALKRANIGVAMGSGTDVAKDVGAMIVVDDNFSSIVAGVEEGRFAYDNVRKVIYLLVSTGAAEVIMFILSIFAGLPLPLLAVQLLWLNLVTNGIQDKALAFEAGEAETMSRKPRDPKEGIFNKIMSKQILISGLIMGLIAFGLWFYLNKFTTMSELHARNMVLLLMVLMQNLHIFNCRSERKSTFTIPISRNYLLILFVLLTQGLHIASMHIPFMQSMLRVEPITLKEWGYVLLLAIPLLVFMELFKFWERRRERI
ncbi:cation-translocating P-type ATPase [Mongoliitalea daihaiensis]|uniref:cation-translocating P-type ATPase n=1 Tax=Mongoliitalea daihaiensis TaxID=2782006 RepID=UPI001F2ED7C4|nr:HAD-IC family P-type ATPase [Mongoliitalea daihaiensis]UJP63720.1 HAD-IC family P-type ATPase [Mongoliitalea daihaiensis]